MVITIVETTVLLPSELIDTDDRVKADEPDWIAIVLFVVGGLLLVIGAVIVFMTLNRPN